MSNGGWTYNYNSRGLRNNVYFNNGYGPNEWLYNADGTPETAVVAGTSTQGWSEFYAGRRRVPHSFALFANEWVMRSARAPKLLHRTSFDLQRPLLIVHPHQTTLTARVGAKAAPLPLAGFEHQPALHRVAVHVAQLFDAFPFAINVEVVEAFLPDRVESRIPERALG